MITNLVAWILALIAMTVCELQASDTCPAPPPPTATATSGSAGNSGATVTNPKIINEI